MIDTHSHIYSKQFDSDRGEMLNRAREAGVKQIFLPNIDVDSIAAMESLADAENDCYPMMGLHPSHVKEDWEDQLKHILDRLHQKPERYVAVGEIGIDLYWDKSFIEAQQSAFAQQIEAALQYELPIVIHCRDAFEEVFAVLENYRNTELYGIFHCFTGNLEQAKQALSLNLKLGIGGVVTFKNGGLDKVVAELSLEDLVLETDAPYLAPAPFRGKRNEPAYLIYVADKLAEIFQTDRGKVEEVTSATARQIFKRAYGN